MTQTTSATRRSWFPVPAWWFPVSIVLDGDARALDPLEEAILGLIASDVQTPRGMADVLGLSSSLVEAACDDLESRQRVARGADGHWEIAVVEDRRTDEPPRPSTFDAWIAWDAGPERPVAQVWLSRERPTKPESMPAQGWDIRPMPNDIVFPPEPRFNDVDDQLRVAAGLETFILLEPMGLAVSRLDGQRVRRLTRRLGERAAQGWLWVPVEQRVTGAAVWRPCLVPRPDVETELERGGLGALRMRLSAGDGQRLDAEQRALSAATAPGVFRESGFETVDALHEWAARERASELGGAAPGWLSQTWGAVGTALSDERIAETTGSDWRALCRGWADVLETLTLDLANRVRAVVVNCRALPVPSGHDRDTLRRLVGEPVYGQFQRLANDPKKYEGLRREFGKRNDAIYARTVGVVVAAAVDRRFRRDLEVLCETYPRFFALLDEARERRNTVVHVGRSNVDVDPLGFRSQVLELCRAVVLLPEPGEA